MPIGLALGIASAGIKLAGGIIGGRRRRKAARANEREARRDAAKAMEEARFQAKRLTQAGERSIGTTVSRATSSGLKVGGSVAEVIETTRSNVAKDAGRILARGQDAAAGLMRKAKGYREQGRQELFSTILGSAGTILGAGFNLSQQFGGQAPTPDIGGGGASGPTGTPVADRGADYWNSPLSPSPAINPAYAGMSRSEVRKFVLEGE